MTLLLLAGTNEARRLASYFAEQGRDVIASLSGATRTPLALDVATRHGGFGGAKGFEHYLQDHSIHAVLDATHPFAGRISARTAEICAQRGVPYCQFLRPQWIATVQDRWTVIADETDAAAHIPVGATVFLATGRQTLERFQNLSGRRLICRQIDPPSGAFPFENGQFLVGRPPFSVADEIALFQELNVDWLVVKNAGGHASFSKLEAARQLKLPVAMIARPPHLNAPMVNSIPDALDWVEKTLG